MLRHGVTFRCCCFRRLLLDFVVMIAGNLGSGADSEARLILIDAIGRPGDEHFPGGFHSRNRSFRGIGGGQDWTISIRCWLTASDFVL